jgi:hypothetical protein
MAEYEETTDKIYEKAYERVDGDSFVYATDTYDDGLEYTQTDFDDFEDDRYEVRHTDPLAPTERDDTVLYTSMNWDEAERFLDALVEE